MTAVAFAAFILRPLLAPVVVAVLLAVVYEPVHRLVERFCGRQTIRSTVVSAILLLALVLLPAFGLGLLLLRQIQGIVEQLAGEGSVESRMVLLLHQVLDSVAGLASKFGFDFDTETFAAEWTDRASSMLYEGLPKLLGNLGQLGLFLAVLLVALAYLLYRGRDLAELIVELSPMEEGHTRQILSRLTLTIQALFIGAFLTAIFQGLFGGLGFWLTGFDNWVVWGTLIAGASFVPFIGTALVWAPAVVYLGYTGHSADAFVLLLVGLAISTIDNVLRTAFHPRPFGGQPGADLLRPDRRHQNLRPDGVVYGPLIAGCFVEAISIYRSDLLLNPPRHRPRAGGRARGAAAPPGRRGRHRLRRGLRLSAACGRGGPGIREAVCRLLSA